jgi:hypothetical protein
MRLAFCPYSESAVHLYANSFGIGCGFGVSIVAAISRDAVPRFDGLRR